jgi:hypothetical protein
MISMSRLETSIAVIMERKGYFVKANYLSVRKTNEREDVCLAIGLAVAKPQSASRGGARGSSETSATGFR